VQWQPLQVLQGFGTKISQHEGSTVKPSWQADEWPSRAAPESAWAESTPGLTTLGLPHAGLHKLPAQQPSASAPAPAQVCLLLLKTSSRSAAFGT